MQEQRTTQETVTAQRARRAHYLLAMGITPWVDRTWTSAPPAQQAAEPAPQAVETRRPSSDIQLVVYLSESARSELSWTEPTGRLLLNMLRALGIDPKKVAFGAPPAESRPVPCWQFGPSESADRGLVLPELDAMLKDPALKQAAWQTLRGSLS